MEEALCTTFIVEASRDALDTEVEIRDLRRRELYNGSGISKIGGKKLNDILYFSDRVLPVTLANWEKYLYLSFI